MKYVCEALMKSGRFQIIQLGGAVKHEKYEPLRFQEFGEDLIVFPIDGYGNEEQIRTIIRQHRPDILWFMTDPRFYYWLFRIENEIRPIIPMVYYHVWDNFPHPMFNQQLYESTDKIVTISKVTSEIVKTVAPKVEEEYLPHSVNMDIFKKLPEIDVKGFKDSNFPFAKDKLLFFWNNRNARRKQSGSIIFWFKKFLDQVGHDKACLVMHTDVKDPNGQELNVILKDLGLDGTNKVLFSQQKLPAEAMSMIYNCADCVINFADAEGFGLGTMEALACETPIIVNMTGGLQEQVTDGKDWFGIGVEPASKAIIGSQDVPYIYEDRVSEKDVVKAFVDFSLLSKEQREEMGRKGRLHLEKNYAHKDFCDRWVQILTDVYERMGSWENRKNYKSWHLFES